MYDDHDSGNAVLRPYQGILLRIPIQAEKSLEYSLLLQQQVQARAP